MPANLLSICGLVFRDTFQLHHYRIGRYNLNFFSPPGFSEGPVLDNMISKSVLVLIVPKPACGHVPQKDLDNDVMDQNETCGPGKVPKGQSDSCFRLRNTI